jgi:hypothetical protein
MKKKEVTPEFVNMSKEILYPQIQGVTLSQSIYEYIWYLTMRVFVWDYNLVRL